MSRQVASVLDASQNRVLAFKAFDAHSWVTVAEEVSSLLQRDRISGLGFVTSENLLPQLRLIVMSFALGFAENSIQLVPDGTLILHVIIILVMVYVLNATLFKPINQILASREKRTRGRLSEAQEILKSVSDKLARYERSLRQARGEAYAVTEAQRAAEMKERQQKLNEMRAQLAQSTAREKEIIQQQAAEARVTLEAESYGLAREIGSRVLSRPISDAQMN